MKIWTPCTTFLWHLKWTTQKRPVGLKKYVKILSLMLCIWFSNGKTMTRFITISQSEQKKRLHGTNQKLKGKQTNYYKARENASGQFAIGSSFASDWGQVIAIS